MSDTKPAADKPAAEKKSFSHADAAKLVKADITKPRLKNGAPVIKDGRYETQTGDCTAADVLAFSVADGAIATVVTIDGVKHNVGK
jgi:hypothetical protein